MAKRAAASSTKTMLAPTGGRKPSACAVAAFIRAMGGRAGPLIATVEGAATVAGPNPTTAGTVVPGNARNAVNSPLKVAGDHPTAGKALETGRAFRGMQAPMGRAAPRGGSPAITSELCNLCKTRRGSAPNVQAGNRSGAQFRHIFLAKLPPQLASLRHHLPRHRNLKKL